MEAQFFSRILQEDKESIFLGQKDFVMQGVYIYDDRKLMLYWNPKAGCTSLAYWFLTNRLDRRLSEEEFTSYRYLEAFYHKCHTLEHPENYKDYRKVLFIRNPFRRVVSLYVNKFVFYPGKGPLRSMDDLERVGRRVVESIYAEDGLDPADYHGITFNRLLLWIASRHEGPSFDRELNFHFTSQVKATYLSLEMISQFDFVCKTERISEVIPDLNRLFGFRFDVDNRNTSGLRSPATGRDFSGLLPDRINQYSDLSYADFLNSENMERIYKIYKEDIYAYVALAR